MRWQQTSGIEDIGEAELIASGGSALVYAATDTSGRRVAVKVLRGMRGAEVQRRFEREQAATERLQDHPNIIDIERSGISRGGEPYLVMPLMQQGTLGDELETGGPFAPEQAIGDVVAIADAIDFAHRRGVLHRDIKPGNVLRGDDGRPIVTDFGIARVVDAGITSATISATTPLYAAPELLEQNEADEQSDTYSLGALLYALLAGAPAFADSPNLWSTISRVRSEAPAVIEGVHPPIMRVVLQAMAKDPIERPPTAFHFRSNLIDAADAAPQWRPPKPAETTLARPRGPEMVPAVPASTVEFDRPADRPVTPTHAAATPGALHDDPGVAVPVRDRAAQLDRPTTKLLGVGLAALVLIGAGWFAVNQAFGSDTRNPNGQPQEPIDTSLPPITPLPTVDPDDADDIDAVPTVEPGEPVDADVTSVPEPTPSQALVSFNGQYFQAYFPEGWSVVRSDVDVGYGFRSEFVADGIYLNVDTTPAELRDANSDILASARDVAGAIESASEVTTETIDGLTMHSFTFRNNRGIDSIDIFFEVDGDGYAIVAGSNSNTETAFAVARQVALTVRSAA